MIISSFTVSEKIPKKRELAVILGRHQCIVCSLLCIQKEMEEPLFFGAAV